MKVEWVCSHLMFMVRNSIEGINDLAVVVVFEQVNILPVLQFKNVWLSSFCSPIVYILRIIL